ncbi:hypothetical protein PGB90_000406 [Kerria lacca]
MGDCCRSNVLLVRLDRTIALPVLVRRAYIKDPVMTRRKKEKKIKTEEDVCNVLLYTDLARVRTAYTG